MPICQCSIRRRVGSVLRLAMLAALPLTVFAGASAHAQAISTAGRGAAIYVFGGASYNQPDYGPDQYKDWGFMFGGGYDRYFRVGKWPVGAGLEARMTRVTGTIVDENTWGGGLRLNTEIYGRIHPFVDALAGEGTLKYHFLPFPSDPNYTQDNGWILQYGFGVDVDVYRNFSVKLDGQQQNWTLGKNYTLGPAIYSAAIVYRIPFRSYIGMNAHRHEKHMKDVPPPAPERVPMTTTTTTTTDSSTTTTTAQPMDNTAPATAPADNNAPAPAPADNTAPPPPPAENTAPAPPPQGSTAPAPPQQ